MLIGPKDSQGLVTSTNRKGYNLKIDYGSIKVQGFKSWEANYRLDTNEKREACVDIVLGLIREGKIKKLAHRYL